MANAPKPGEQRKRKQRATSTTLVVTVDGTRYELVLPLPIGEQRALRLATGLPLEQHLRINGRDAVGLDTVAVFVWLARRQAGERSLALAAVDADLEAVMARVGTDPALADELLSVELVDDDEVADPEG